MYSLLPYTLHRVRDSRAARACPSSQAADDWKSCAERPFPSLQAEPAAHRVEVHERCALDQVCPSRPTYASHIARATSANRSARARRAHITFRCAAASIGAHAPSPPSRAQVRMTTKWMASLVDSSLEVLPRAGVAAWRSRTQERCLAPRQRSVPEGSVADGTVG